MPTLRERFIELLAGDRLADLEKQAQQAQQTLNVIGAFYEAGRAEQLPETTLARLLEYYDPSVVSDLLSQMDWEILSGTPGLALEERARAVKESRRVYKYSILARWGVNLWSAYGLGENVDIVPSDTTYDVDDEAMRPNPLSAKLVWEEFWTADRNVNVFSKNKLDDLSRWLLVTGERFFAFFASRQDGETTIRNILPEQITKTYVNPDDDAVIWFYRREYQTPKSVRKILLYPDWHIFFEEHVEAYYKLALEHYPDLHDATPVWTLPEATNPDTNGTDACILFVPFLQVDEESPRGWPLMAPHGTPWLRAHREFMQDRSAVSKAVAAFVRRYKVAGGSRAVSSIASTLASTLSATTYLDTNPPPVAGSADVINRMVDAEELPLKTGAIDAKADGEMFAWFAALSLGVFPHYMGMGDAYRLATATAMEKPLELQFSQYRNLLGSIFRSIVRIVLQFKEHYSEASYETFDAEISTDRLVELDLTQITEAISRLSTSTLTPARLAGDLPDDTYYSILNYLLQTALQALGADNVDEIVNVEQFEQMLADREEEEQEEPEQVPPMPPTEEQVSAEVSPFAPTEEEFRRIHQDVIDSGINKDILALMLTQQEIPRPMGKVLRSYSSGRVHENLLCEADLQALSEAEPSTRHPLKNRKALAAYKDELQAIYNDWAENAADELAGADEEDREELIAALLAMLALQLKRAGRQGMADAFEVGLAGNTPTAEALAALDEAITQNDWYVDNSLIPAIRERLERDSSVEGFTWEGPALGDIFSGMKWRVNLYAGAVWFAIGIGVWAAMMRRGDPPTRRYLDPSADHCETCPPKAHEYESYSSMVAQVGLPSDGSDQCRSNCRCGVDAFIDGAWIPIL